MYSSISYDYTELLTSSVETNVVNKLQMKAILQFSFALYQSKIITSVSLHVLLQASQTFSSVERINENQNRQFDSLILYACGWVDG